MDADPRAGSIADRIELARQIELARPIELTRPAHQNPSNARFTQNFRSTWPALTPESSWLDWIELARASSWLDPSNQLDPHRAGSNARSDRAGSRIELARPI